MISRRHLLLGGLALPLAACSDFFGPMKRIRVEADIHPLVGVISNCFHHIKEYNLGNYKSHYILKKNLEIAAENGIIKGYSVGHYVSYRIDSKRKHKISVHILIDNSDKIKYIDISEKENGIVTAMFI